MSKYDPFCDKCGNNLVEVSRVYHIPFYACQNEKCEDYAELKINLGSPTDPKLIGYYEMIEQMSVISKENLLDDVKLLDEEEHF